MTIESDKLILGGHSFGGVTAISVAEKDSRVKAVFSFDPWTWPRNDVILSDKFCLKVP